MKHILLSMLVIVAVCTSCEKNQDSDDGRYSDYGQVKGYDTNYNGHNYIVFYGGGTKPIGIVHDPDCKCSTKK